jgi:hypothetical protein
LPRWTTRRLFHGNAHVRQGVLRRGHIFRGARLVRRRLRGRRFSLGDASRRRLVRRQLAPRELAALDGLRLCVRSRGLRRGEPHAGQDVHLRRLLRRIRHRLRRRRRRLAPRELAALNRLHSLSRRRILLLRQIQSDQDEDVVPTSLHHRRRRRLLVRSQLSARKLAALDRLRLARRRRRLLRRQSHAGQDISRLLGGVLRRVRCIHRRLVARELGAPGSTL